MRMSSSRTASRAPGFFPLHRNPAALPASVLQASPRYPAPSPADSRYNQSVPETEGRIRSTVCFHFHHPQHKVRTRTILPEYPARRLPVLHPTTESCTLSHKISPMFGLLEDKLISSLIRKMSFFCTAMESGSIFFVRTLTSGISFTSTAACVS